MGGGGVLKFVPSQQGIVMQFWPEAPSARFLQLFITCVTWIKIPAILLP